MARVAYFGEYSKGIIGKDGRGYAILFETPFHIIFGNTIVEKSGLVPKPYKKFYETFQPFGCPMYAFGEYADTAYNSYVYLFTYNNEANYIVPLSSVSLAGNRAKAFYFDVDTNLSFVLFRPFNSGNNSNYPQLFILNEGFGSGFDIMASSHFSSSPASADLYLIPNGSNVYIPSVIHYPAGDRVDCEFNILKFDTTGNQVNSVQIYKNPYGTTDTIFSTYLGRSDDYLFFLFSYGSNLALVKYDISDDSFKTYNLSGISRIGRVVFQGALLDYEQLSSTYSFVIWGRDSNGYFNIYRLDYNDNTDSINLTVIDSKLIDGSSNFEISDKATLELRLDAVEKRDSVYVFAFSCNKYTSDNEYAAPFVDASGERTALLAVYKYSKTTKNITKIDLVRFRIPVFLAAFNKEYTYGKFSSSKGTVDVVFDYQNDRLSVLGYSDDRYYVLVRDEFDRFWGIDGDGYLELFGKKIPYRVERYIEVESDVWNNSEVNGNVVINVYDELGNRVQADVVLTIPNPSAVIFSDGSTQKIVTTNTDSDTKVPIKILAPTGVIVGVSVKCISG